MLTKTEVRIRALPWSMPCLELLHHEPGSPHASLPPGVLQQALASALSVSKSASADPARPTGEGSEDASDRSFSLLGYAPEGYRATLGMWRLHPYQPDFPKAEWSDGLAFRVSQYFVARLTNSYYDRAYAGGSERRWGGGHVDPLSP